MYKVPDCLMQSFADFLEKDLGLVSQSHFVYYFSKKVFLMLHSIN